MEFHADEVVIGCDAFRIYRSGKMDRLHLHLPARVPAGLDPATGVTSKDVVLDASTGLSARLFLPTSRGARGSSSEKLPILVFFHGGAFLIESAVSPLYHGYVASLAAAAGVLAVSVEYRLAPEHPVPAAYDDAWGALQWAASARDEWIAEHGDVARLFLAGDSAGGNMVHNVLVKLASSSHPAAPRIEGAILLHPWFGGNTPVEGEDATKAKEMAMIWEFRVPRHGRRRGRPADEPDGAGRAGAGEPPVRADARVRRREGLGGGAGPRVLRRRGRERVAGEHRVVRVGRGGARVLPREAGVHQG
ncbi:hypothetical protein SEVIR_2G242500v4 [Setaria viridis]|uniref:Alpha/beta hydrolase fold-3 domain-containing protein n=1 Tax=Setaria viridis TaxID=4556 RepID=A0A4V6DBC3_SETVI|nr:hypothetical protein SEVIR_2G242500v2 [Setaria viridis]